MKHVRAMLAVTALLAVSCAGLRLAGSGPTKTITILYTGDLDWTRLPEISSLIRATEPALTVINGRILDTGLVGSRFAGQAEMEALANSGVSAVCVTPDFLRFGVPNARRLIDSAAPGVFFLSTNVYDSLKQGPLGQAYVKTGHPGSKSGDRLAVAGMLTDSSAPHVQQRGLYWLNPGVAARRVMPQMKMNADLLGVALWPSGETQLPGFDFAIGSKSFGTAIAGTAIASTVYQLELQLDRQNRIVAHHVIEIDLTNVEPDPGVQAIVKRWQTRSDSLNRKP